MPGEDPERGGGLSRDSQDRPEQCEVHCNERCISPRTVAHGLRRCFCGIVGRGSGGSRVRMLSSFFDAVARVFVDVGKVSLSVGSFEEDRSYRFNFGAVK